MFEGFSLHLKSNLKLFRVGGWWLAGTKVIISLSQSSWAGAGTELGKIKIKVYITRLYNGPARELRTEFKQRRAKCEQPVEQLGH